MGNKHGATSIAFPKKPEIFDKATTVRETVEEGVRTDIAQTSQEEAVVAFSSLYILGTVEEETQKDQ